MADDNECPACTCDCEDCGCVRATCKWCGCRVLESALSKATRAKIGLD